MTSCIYIPPVQREFQKATEAISLFAAAPILLYAAVKETAIPRPARVGLGILGALAILVDGGFLSSWTRCVSPERRDFHIATELLSLAVTMPLTWIASKSPGIDSTIAAGLKAVSVGTLISDGWLLTQWGK